MPPIGRQDRDVAITEAATPEAERMARLLRFASYSEVGRALGVKRSTVQKWATGKNVGAAQLRQVEELYAQTFPPDFVVSTAGQPVTVIEAKGLPAQEPAWAKALMAQVIRNEAMLLALQRHFQISDEHWHEAISDVVSDREILEIAEARLLHAPARRGASAADADSAPEDKGSRRDRAPAARGRRR